MELLVAPMILLAVALGHPWIMIVLGVFTLLVAGIYRFCNLIRRLRPYILSILAHTWMPAMVIAAIVIILVERNY